MEILITENQFRELSNILIEQKEHPYIRKGLLSQEEFDKIKNILNNETRKYFDFLLKAYVNGYKNIPQMKNIIEEFHVFATKGKTKYKDINQYKTFNELIDDVNILNQTGSAISKKEWQSDYDVIRDDGDVIIYVPHSHEAARKLSMSKFGWKQCSEGEGLETPYCIAYKTPKHFDDYYYKHNVTFYLIRAISPEMKNRLKRLAIKFNRSNEDDFEVFALSVYGEKMDSDDVPIINGYPVEGTTKHNESVMDLNILKSYLDVIDFQNIKPIRDKKERDEKYQFKLYQIIEDYIKNGSVGELDLSELPIKTLGNLQTVGGELNLFKCTSLISLGNLKKVEGYLSLFGCISLTSLENLQSVGGSLNLAKCTSLTSLGKLESVGRDLNLENCTSLTSLGNLQTVGGTLNLRDCTSLVSLGNLQIVRGWLVLHNCEKIESLPENLEVKRDIQIRNSGLAKYSEEELNEMYPKLKGKFKY
jgi:hypothetical protein